MGTKNRPALDLRQFLPYRVSRFSERVSASLSRIYSERFGISVPEWRVLTWVNQLDSASAREICRNAVMDKATVSRAVQRLAERGLLQRVPSPADQRLLTLSLTEQGEALLAELVPEAHAWEARLLEPLSAQEYRDLLNLMSKLERQLDRIQGEGGEPSE